MAAWTAGGKLRSKYTTRAALEVWMDKQCAKAVRRKDRKQMANALAANNNVTASANGGNAGQINASSSGRMSWMLPPPSVST